MWPPKGSHSPGPACSPLTRAPRAAAPGQDGHLLAVLLHGNTCEGLTNKAAPASPSHGAVHYLSSSSEAPILAK